MYYNSYEDYINNNQGYGGYEGISNGFNSSNTYPMYNEYNRNQETDYDSLYPDIYHKVNPLVENSCMKYQNTRISKEIVEEIANKVYIQYNDLRSSSDIKNDLNRISNSSTTTKKEETRSGRNETLMDLIKILIIKNLFPRKLHRPGRPPIRPNPGISPYPNWHDGGMQGPGMPPYRPTFY